jgi:thioredoxin 1
MVAVSLSTIAVILVVVAVVLYLLRSMSVPHERPPPDEIWSISTPGNIRPGAVSHFEGSADDFVQLLSKLRGLIVVDFWAPSCPPCRHLGAQLPEIAAENSAAYFVKVDVDVNRALTSQFRIGPIPHVKFFRDGSPREVGAVLGCNIPAIKAKIRELA